MGCVLRSHLIWDAGIRRFRETFHNIAFYGPRGLISTLRSLQSVIIRNMRLGWTGLSIWILQNKLHHFLKLVNAMATGQIEHRTVRFKFWIVCKEITLSSLSLSSISPPTSLKTNPDPNLSLRRVSTQIKVTVKVGFIMAPSHWLSNRTIKARKILPKISSCFNPK